jgi:hypothetical protein
VSNKIKNICPRINANIFIFFNLSLENLSFCFLLAEIGGDWRAENLKIIVFSELQYLCRSVMIFTQIKVEKDLFKTLAGWEGLFYARCFDSNSSFEKKQSPFKRYHRFDLCIIGCNFRQFSRLIIVPALRFERFWLSEKRHQ